MRRPDNKAVGDGNKVVRQGSKDAFLQSAPGGPVRGTQSFVRTLSECWRRPGLTLREVAWRWAYGIPAVGLALWQGRKILLAATNGTLDPAAIGLDRALLADPVGALTANTMGAAGKIGLAFTALTDHCFPAAYWVVPVLLLGWIVVSSVGRSTVAQAADPAMRSRIGALMALQAIRTTLLFALCGFWFLALTAAASALVARPLAASGEPNLVGFSAVVIILSLTLFTAWAAMNWVLSVAPLLAMLRGLGTLASLRAAFALGTLRGKLIEINLVMGIIKIALVVLAMVFSATPLPFQTVTSAEFLAWWWAGVTLLYLLWSDFFHVVHLVSYIDLWRSLGPKPIEEK